MAGGRSSAREGRPPRSSRFDPRLAIGLALVILSVLGVYGIVAAADRSEVVLSAGSDLGPGDRIRASDLVVRNVRLGEVAGSYLTPEDVPGEGLLVTRPVTAGELVPVSAVGGVSGIRVAPVVVTVSGQLSKAIGPGAVVDVWSAAEAAQGVFGPPAVLVGSATVVRVIESSGLVAGRGDADVEILVSRTRIARVLEAVANGDAVSLVPMSVPLGR